MDTHTILMALQAVRFNIDIAEMDGLIIDARTGQTQVVRVGFVIDHPGVGVFLVGVN